MVDKVFPVGGKVALVEATPVLTVHSSYAPADFVGTSATPISFTPCVLSKGGSGTIVTATLIDYALQSVAGELWLFDTTFTAPTDSAAWTVTDAVMLTLVGIIPFPATDYYASAANSACIVPNVGLSFKCASGSNTLFGAFVTRGAPSYASGDLTFRLLIWED